VHGPYRVLNDSIVFSSIDRSGIYLNENRCQSKVCFGTRVGSHLYGMESVRVVSDKDSDGRNVVNNNLL
jgi:hypothetical protein